MDDKLCLWSQPRSSVSIIIHGGGDMEDSVPTRTGSTVPTMRRRHGTLVQGKFINIEVEKS